MRDRVIEWLTVLGPRHAKFQRRIFELLLLPGIFHILWELSSDRFKSSNGFLWMRFWHSTLNVIALWTTLAVAVSLLSYIMSRGFNFDLYIYYRIWLRRLKPRHWLTEREKDIVQSFEFFRPDDKRWRHKRPCFVLREDLMRKRFWPSWDFAIVTLFGNHKDNPKKVWQDVALEDHRKRWRLHINLTDESYGIYSDDGKEFLKQRFLYKNAAAIEEVQNRSKVIQESMQPSRAAGEGWSWNDSGCQLPIRWASGGILPLVWHKGSYWVLLFFRDIPPIGLNAPNGASERKDEYKDIRKLLVREFCEEVVVLSGLPTKGAVLSQLDFNAQHHEFAPFMNEPYAKRHADLREKCDDFKIEPISNPAREVEPVKTPFEVHVTHHLPNLKQPVTLRPFKNIIYTVNPSELGIEIMALGQFSLGDREYIIDGEYDLDRKVLIRRPPVLLKLQYLSDLYDRNSSLGTLCGRGTSADGKLMDEVSQENCIVFDADVALRKSRRGEIQEYLRRRSPRGDRLGDLKWELKRIIDGWLAKYGDAVTRIKEKGLTGNEPSNIELRTLCPVTWKSLEQAFAHRLLADLLATERRMHRPSIVRPRG